MKKLFLTISVMLLSFFLLGASPAAAEQQTDIIRWVDFNAKSDLMQRLYELDVNSVGKEVRFDFVEMLAYISLKNGNSFKTKNDLKTLNKLKAKLESGKTVTDLAGSNKYYQYYKNAYCAIFKEYFGWYQTDDGETRYGLKAYSPIAKGFGYSEADDFGNSRSFGFKRRHLGHDMFGATGTPIVAVEGGTVTECGWNRYGGWRVGIRSHDGLRYYYYAHLKKDRPYAEGLEKGAEVEAGQVVGYLGVTGYSTKENVNMKARPHLHFGLQLIFDPSQEDGNGEIWIDVYQLAKFLKQNRAAVERQDDGHYRSVKLRKAIDFSQDI